MPASIKRTTAAHVGRILLDDEGPNPVLLLGAGASARSGVPMATELVELAARWGYCDAHGHGHADPGIKRSDWWPWLCDQPWFDRRTALVDQYPTVIEQLLQPRENRRAFFLRTLKHRAELSAGYGALADLVLAGLLNTILTPNFDGLLPEALRLRPELRHFDSIESPAGAELISTAPIDPQVIWVHGSVAHYSDQNLEHETRQLAPVLLLKLRPIIADHPLIVIGYRGAEPSIMTDLLLGSADDAHGYRQGIYWCARSEDPDQLHPLVAKLAARLGSNFQLVPIEGFDECMAEWARSARASGRLHPRRSAHADDIAVSDLQPAAHALSDLDWTLVSEKLQAYSASLDLAPVEGADRDTLIRRLIELDLAVPSSGGVVPTRAGALLFAREHGCTVEIRFGKARVRVQGNLFHVLERVGDQLDELNAPYRLKGALSEDVRAFDPRALKEILVNALVHRDHQRHEPVRIRFSEQELQVTSPGGLVPELEPDRLGQPGVKAYRNPVLADLMYGTGMMDKAGSGLADARRWSRAAAGDARFGPNEGNTVFVAALLGRPQRPDPSTGTADPGHVEQFLTNILPVTISATEINAALCHHAYAREIFELQPDAELPAFFLHDGRLWTFSDLDDPSNPLAAHVHGELRRSSVQALLDGGDRQRLLVQLLNRMMFAYAGSLGLAVYRDKRRLWFPRSDDGPRTVTYRARIREATRTVTKPLPRRRDGTRRWEHESVGFSFRRYGEDWALHLVPGWTFTHDGREQFMRGPRVASLSTRRASRDYNPQVANHLYFWLWVLTQGQEQASIDPLAGAVTLGGRLLTVASAEVPAAIPGFDAGIGEEEGEVREQLAELDDPQPT
jgi:hypothetical protein